MLGALAAARVGVPSGFGGIVAGDRATPGDGMVELIAPVARIVCLVVTDCCFRGFGGGWVPGGPYGARGPRVASGRRPDGVSRVEPHGDGSVRIVLRDSVGRDFSGSVADPAVQSLLVAAVRDSADAGGRHT